MSKTIIFCADGTWNAPDQDEDHDGVPEPTNVFKLFSNLCGTPLPGSTRLADEQEIEYRQNGRVVQAAKYIHGVGDSHNAIYRILGGAFGSGLISRIVRGYTYISRQYEDGDQIVIVGFSRGAYTARALAGLIAGKGLLNKGDPANPGLANKELAYRRGAQAWYQFREGCLKKDRPNIFARFAEVVSDLPGFLTQGQLQADDVVPVPAIAAVAVWDTVGAMGVPAYQGDARVDAFKFVDNALSSKVKVGLHAIAIDERRKDFTPTYWAPATNVVQMLFPGSHADVGGGYPECGLSDGALAWMQDELTRRAGVQFLDTPAIAYHPDPGARSHEPWMVKPWNIFASGAVERQLQRDFGLLVHESVHLRRELQSVESDPSGPHRYNPSNLP